MPMLSMLESRADLSDEARRALLALPCIVRTLDAGAYVAREGDVIDRCLVLAEGMTYHHRVVGNGGRQITGFRMAGEVLIPPFSPGQRLGYNVQALTKAKVVSIEREALDAFAQHHADFWRAMWTAALADLSGLREGLATLGRRDARERTAHLLCWFYVKQRGLGMVEGNSFNLPLTQEQLADMIGLTPVHVNRTLKQLESEGLIVRKVRDVTIPDWAALATAGDFDPEYLRLKKRDGSADIR
jgi:CRP-like cAMP-binding protein